MVNPKAIFQKNIHNRANSMPRTFNQSFVLNLSFIKVKMKRLPVTATSGFNESSQHLENGIL